MRRISGLVSKAPGTQFGQVPAFSELTGLKIRHDAFLNTIKTALFDGGMVSLST